MKISRYIRGFATILLSFACLIFAPSMAAASTQSYAPHVSVNFIDPGSFESSVSSLVTLFRDGVDVVDVQSESYLSSENCHRRFNVSEQLKLNFFSTDIVARSEAHRLKSTLAHTADARNRS